MEKIQELVDKGKVLLEDGKFDDALGFFEQALLLNQDDPDFAPHRYDTFIRAKRILGSGEEEGIYSLAEMIEYTFE